MGATPAGAMLEVTVETTLRGPLAETLLAEAKKRNMRPADLMADIVETVLCENLVTPVLDDDQSERTGA